MKEGHVLPQIVILVLMLSALQGVQPLPTRLPAPHTLTGEGDQSPTPTVPAPPVTPTPVAYPPPPPVQITPGPPGQLIGEALPIAVAVARQQAPDVVYNSRRDEYLVVWSDRRHHTSWYVYGQRITADGRLLGGSFPVAHRAPGNPGLDTWPAVAYRPASDEYLVVWSDEEIFGRRVSGDGQLLGDLFSISKKRGGGPAVAYNPQEDEFLVTWVYDGLFGQRVSLAGGGSAGLGVPQPAPILPSQPYPPPPPIQPTPAPSGQLIGHGFPIAERPALPCCPALVYSGTAHEYLVVWEDLRYSGFLVTTGHDIYAQRISADGQLLGAPLTITTAITNQRAPVVAHDPDLGDYLVLWSDPRHGGGSFFDVYGQWISAEGELIGANFPISTSPAGQEVWSLARNDATGKYLVVWTEGRGRLVSQQLSSRGEPVGDDFVIAEDGAWAALAYSPVVSEHLVVWQTAKDIHADIYAQRVALAPPPPAEIPEPSTLILLVSGLAGLAGYSLLRRRRARGTLRERGRGPSTVFHRASRNE